MNSVRSPSRLTNTRVKEDNDAPALKQADTVELGDNQGLVCIWAAHTGAVVSEIWRHVLRRGASTI